ncbi:MAG: glycosyltransferase family 2 protein [Ruthenibacterium lactatiformans]
MKKGENTVRYDIVMVTYNSMKWLRACVAALAAVQYPLEELHLVFADNGSTDGTLEELRRMAGEYPAFGGFTVAKTARTLGSARHATAARQGSAPLLFFEFGHRSLARRIPPPGRGRRARAAKRRRLSAVSFPMKQGITSIP